MRLPSRALPLALCVALLSALLSSCGLDDAAALDSRVFVLQSAAGFRPVETTMVQLAFQNGQLNVRAGCNSIFGSFELENSRLIVDELASTELGCDSALEAQDQWLQSFFTSQPTVTLATNELTLHGALATLVFISPDIVEPKLVDTVWSVDTFFEGGSASNFFLLPGPTVQFSADQMVHVDTTCNTATGIYTTNGNSIKLSKLTFTSLPCSGAAKSADAHLRKLLRASTLTFEIEGGRLTLGTTTLGIGAIVGSSPSDDPSSP